jgi:hypothetical protein
MGLLGFEERNHPFFTLGLSIRRKTLIRDCSLFSLKKPSNLMINGVPFLVAPAIANPKTIMED